MMPAAPLRVHEEASVTATAPPSPHIRHESGLQLRSKLMDILHRRLMIIRPCNAKGGGGQTAQLLVHARQEAPLHGTAWFVFVCVLACFDVVGSDKSKGALGGMRTPERAVLWAYRCKKVDSLVERQTPSTRV